MIRPNAAIDEQTSIEDGVGLRNIEAILIDEPLSGKRLQTNLERSPENEVQLFWTPKELALVEKFAPSVFHRVSENLDISEDNVESVFYRLALQAQSKIVNEQSVLDSAIFHERFDQQQLVSKLNRYQKTSHLIKLLDNETYMYPISDSSVSYGMKNPLNLLLRIKDRYRNILNAMPEWFKESDTEIKKPDYSMDRIEKTHPYVLDVLNALGDKTVKAIINYGSGSREIDPSNIQDWDNYVLIGKEGWFRPDSRDIYEKLMDIELVNQADGKPISFNIIDEKSFPRFINMGHDSREALESCNVLYGEAAFPVVGFDEITERGFSHAVIRSLALKAAAAWSVEEPEIFLDKEQLFDYYQKTQRFLVQAALNYHDGLAVREKYELDSQIHFYGGEIAMFDPSKGPEYVTESICNASATASIIMEDMFPLRDMYIPINHAQIDWKGRLELIEGKETLHDMFEFNSPSG